MASYNLLGRDVEEVCSPQVHESFSRVDDIFYMPDLIRARIATESAHRVWQTWWTAPSLRATGRTAAGTPVVLYAHVKNFYSDGNNIKKAIEEKKLVRGAGILPREEFARLLSLEGNGVSVVDYVALKKSTNGVIRVDEALKHPQTLSFLGVSEEEAQALLRKHKSIYGANIGIYHFDDLANEPLARVLFLGVVNFNYYLNDNLDSDARVLGVRRRASVSEPVSAAGAPQKNFRVPTLEEVLLEELILFQMLQENNLKQK